MRDDEKERAFRPRLGKRLPRNEEHPHRLLRRTLALQARKRSQGRPGSSFGRSRIAATMPGSDARRVTVQTSYVRMTTRGAAACADHLRYIQRDGVTPSGGRGELYGPTGPVPPESFEEPRSRERHQFRIMISPDDGRDLDLTLFVRQVMARIEHDVGRKLEWAAANHYNTNHPHAHVIVRGVDLDGREVRFERAYISNGMRWHAQEIATQELGPRSEHEIRRAHGREVTEERFTSLDRELERRMEGQRVALRTDSRAGAIHEGILCARLEHLQAMDLAVPVSASEWDLRPGWQRTLRDLAIRGDIIKQMHRALAGDPSHYQIVGPGQPMPDGRGGVVEETLVGRVVAKGLADEQKGIFFAVIEATSGFAYHVSMGSAAKGIRIGDWVAFGSKRIEAVLPIDRHIAAAATSATYRLGDTETASAVRAEAVLRRLRTLQRAGLAREESHGAWRIAPDLLERLQARQADHPPRYRLSVRKQPMTLDQMGHYRGPVWLDEIGEDTLPRHGIGAEVRRALARRSQVLGSLGVAPRDPERIGKLAQLELAVVAKQFAYDTQQQAVDLGPEGFRGVARAFVTPSGSGYIVVSDGQNFVVAPAPETRRWRARTVTLVRDSEGHPRIREGRERGVE